jgi:hypothetical protein
MILRGGSQAIASRVMAVAWSETYVQKTDGRQQSLKLPNLSQFAIFADRASLD